MGFDPMCNSKFRKWEETGCVGSSEKHTVKCDILADTEVAVPFAGMLDFKLYSEKTPTREELMSASVKMNLRWFNLIANNADCKMDTTTTDIPAIFCTGWMGYASDESSGGLPFYVLVAYETGTHTVQFSGYNIPVEVSKTGLYIGVTYEAMDDLKRDKDGYFNLNIAWETIRPIDQKFIPTVDSLTFNGADGKQYKVTVDENGALSIAEV